jgi:hypothetical protein
MYVPPATSASAASSSVEANVPGVDEGRAETESAIRRRVAGQPAHAFELVGRWRPVVVSDLVHAECGRAHERRDVDRDAEPHEVIETLPQGGPGNVVLDVCLPLDLIAAHRVGERAHRRSLPEHLERDALAHVALRPAVCDE